MKKVFLIDDDDDDREIFGEALATLNHNLEFAEAINGLDAFEKLNSPGFKKPDVIFLDLNMPKMDGREFLIEIKKKQEFSHIPIIIYSTSSNARDIEFTLSNQATRFMTKHHSIFELQEQLDSLFKELNS